MPKNIIKYVIFIIVGIIYGVISYNLGKYNGDKEQRLNIDVEYYNVTEELLDSIGTYYPQAFDTLYLVNDRRMINRYDSISDRIQQLKE